MIERLLFHWSPRDRREAIEAHGFAPGSRSIHDDWNPPYTCWAYSPSAAWGLSGGMHGHVAPEWDLWMVWRSALPDGKIETIRNRKPEKPVGAVKEVRVWEPIPAGLAWWVGSRPPDAQRRREQRRARR